jgi:hypothetical protein
MKLRFLFLAGALLLRGMPSSAAEPFANGNFQAGLEGWQIDSPKSAEAVATVVPGPEESAKALKIEMGDGEMDSWEGKLHQTFSLREAGTYVIHFQARVEPSDSSLELSVWAARSGKSERIGERQKEQAGTDWRQFQYVFTIEQPEEALDFSCSGLARPGTTWFFTAFKLTKE